MKSLLLGCGSRRDKDIDYNQCGWGELKTLDHNQWHNPDIVHDLRIHPLPCEDNEYNEIHAYDVLEHLAFQGDYRFFFAEFSEYWRILKPDGLFCATVPREGSVWVWGDPSHTRLITPEQLAFLDQKFYDQVGKTKASDFRNIYKANFKIEAMSNVDENAFVFVLRAIK